MSSQPEQAQYGPPWTVLKLLKWSAGFFEDRGIESPRLDAELMLARTLGIDRVRLYMEYDKLLSDDELDRYRALVKRRAAGEPVAYITGSRAFWTIEVATDPRALIPRSDTEVLVEEALEILAENAGSTVVDVGTGTGAIALALAAERPGIDVVATDASADAVSLATENARALGLTERVDFYVGDLLGAVPDEDLPVEMIVSNPPYVAEDDEDLMREVRETEPREALFAGEDGLEVIRRLVEQAYESLKPDGWFLCEIGHTQGDAVRALFEDAGFEDVAVRRDYGDRDRVVKGRRR